MRSSRSRSRRVHVSSYFFARLVADGDAVEADRAADVETVADIPRELALLPIHRHPGRTQDLELLAFVEHVLLERLAVDLAALQDFLHERIELVGDWWGRSWGGFRRRLLRGDAGGQRQKCRAARTRRSRGMENGSRMPPEGWLASSVDESGRDSGSRSC